MRQDESQIQYFFAIQYVGSLFESTRNILDFVFTRVFGLP